MNIMIKQGSILVEDVDALIIPTNTTGALIGDFLLQVKAVAGDDVEEEAISQAPIIVGQAIMTKAGDLRATMIIHAPVTEFPDGKTDEHAVLSALLAALELAEENNVQLIGLPLYWHLPQGRDASTVLAVLAAHHGFVTDAILADPDAELVKNWQAHLDKGTAASAGKKQTTHKVGRSPKP
jgi:hypothetical protein